jgi:uncharacterized protein (TIGR00369 family)
VSGDTIGMSLADARRTLSGLEFFRKMVDGTLKLPAMVTLLGLRLLEVEEGRVVFAGTATEQFYNGLGIAHGGFAATLLDSALGCAINTTQPAGRMFTTLELKINYTRPLTREAGEVRCEATVVHVGSRTATAEARVVDAEGRIYAHGTTTCIVI